MNWVADFEVVFYNQEPDKGNPQPEMLLFRLLKLPSVGVKPKYKMVLLVVFPEA